jgi:hypothetical protein
VNPNGYEGATNPSNRSNEASGTITASRLRLTFVHGPTL